MKEKLLMIIENEDVYNIIPFLRQLGLSQREELVSVIKACIKHYTQYIFKDERFPEIRGTAQQFTILSIAAFVCLNYKDYKRNRIRLNNFNKGFIKFHEYTQQELMGKIRMDDILEWYHPEWMSDFINDSRTNEQLKDFLYDEVMQWNHKGYIELTPELIVATLVSFPYVLDTRSNRYLLQIDRLFRYSETLDEHIWLLFRYPSDIYYDLTGGMESERNNWKSIFKTLITNGRIDRMRVLRECLLTAGHNFKRSQAGWFIELFNELQPTVAELLDMQDELIKSIASTQPKVAINALTHLKTICSIQSLKLDDLLACVPPAFVSSGRITQSYMVDLIAKLIEARYESAFKIATALATGLTSNSEFVQKRVAGLLAMYSRPDQMGPVLTEYADSILPSVKPILAHFFETPLAGKNDLQAIPNLKVFAAEPHIREDNEVLEITTFDDLLCFLNKVFDKEEPWYSIMIPYYIQKFNSQLTRKKISLLEPIFKKATRYSNSASGQIGAIDRLIAAYFVSYGKLLTRKYPEYTKNLQKYLRRNGKLDLAIWPTLIRHYELYPLYYILLKSFNSLKNDYDFTILSTPTHTPLWIDPVVLVQRLKTYQDRKISPHNFDLQLALQRCALDNNEEALLLAQQQLNGEVKELLLFLLDPEISAPTCVDNPSWWMTASLNKHPHTIPLNTKKWGFGHIPTSFITGNYSFRVATSDNVTKAEFVIPPFQFDKQDGTAFICEYYYSLFAGEDLYFQDIARLIASAPYHHDYITLYLLTKMDDSGRMPPNHKLSIMNALNSIRELKVCLSHMDTLLLGACFFSPDEQIKDSAASLWSETVLAGFTDNHLLGKAIVDFNQSGWLPFEDFYKLIESHLTNISMAHDLALEELLAVLIAGLDNKTGGKPERLVEIYNGILSTNTTRDKRPQHPTNLSFQS